MTALELDPNRPYGEMLYTAEQVDERIDQMAAWLIHTYKGKKPLFASLLNGADPFFSKLMFSIARQDPHFHPEGEFLTISRYQQRRDPSADADIVMDLPPRFTQEGLLEGRLVLPIDDMRDKGGTLKVADELCREHGAAEVQAVTLVLKEVPPEEVIYDQEPFYGFNTPDVWLTGMGGDDSSIAPNANRYAPWVATARGHCVPEGWLPIVPDWVQEVEYASMQPQGVLLNRVVG